MQRGPHQAADGVQHHVERRVLCGAVVPRTAGRCELSNQDSNEAPTFLGIPKASTVGGNLVAVHSKMAKSGSDRDFHFSLRAINPFFHDAR